MPINSLRVGCYVSIATSAIFFIIAGIVAGASAFDPSLISLTTHQGPARGLFFIGSAVMVAAAGYLGNCGGLGLLNLHQLNRPKNQQPGTKEGA